MATEIYGIYSAPIAYEHCNAFLQILWNYAKGRDHVLHLAISSDGGDMTAGIMVFNALRSLPITLKTYNLGSVNSVANAMFLAGETRCAAPSSSFGYHSAGFYTQPNIRIDAKLVREWASKLKTDNERLAAILLDRTDLDAAAIDNLFETEQFMSATWAHEHRVAHDIRTFEIPDGATKILYTS